MTKWTYAKSLFKLIFSKKKKWELQTGHKVKLEFYSGGTPYYQLHDLFDTFTERGLEAYQVYEELSMRVDAETLKQFIAKFKQLCNSNPIQILEVSKVLNFLEERVNFVVPPRDMIYKMAAVAYFDENESPYTFNAAYAHEKIERWKKNNDVDAFFLYKQLRDLIPLPNLSKEIYEMLVQTTEKIINYQLKNISGKASATPAEHSTSNGKE